MGQGQTKLAVVSQKDQSLAVEVQAPDRMQVSPFLGQQLVNRRTVQFIFTGANEASRLIKGQVNLALGLDRLAIDAYRVSAGFDLDAKDLGFLSVHCDPAGPDHLFTRSSGKYPGLGPGPFEGEPSE